MGALGQLQQARNVGVVELDATEQIDGRAHHAVELVVCHPLQEQIDGSRAGADRRRLERTPQRRHGRSPHLRMLLHTGELQQQLQVVGLADLAQQGDAGTAGADLLLVFAVVHQRGGAAAHGVDLGGLHGTAAHRPGTAGREKPGPRRRPP